LEVKKKAKYKKLFYWLLIDLAVALILFALLLYRPGRYKPGDFRMDDDKPGRDWVTHPYLTHEVYPEVYNGAQLGEPFEVVISQKGLNSVVADSGWPKESEGILLYGPAVLLVPDTVVFMGTANIKGVEMVVTIELTPKVNEQKLLVLDVSKVKVGAMNITPLAKMTAKRMYAQKLSDEPMDTEDLRTKIAGALLNEEAFGHIFKIEDKKVKVDKITVKEGKLIVRLIPVSSLGDARR
jgi:hypothetical protein